MAKPIKYLEKRQFQFVDDVKREHLKTKDYQPDCYDKERVRP